MASRGWYAEKMMKLKKCKVAEMKERNAISAIDEKYSSSVIFKTKAEERDENNRKVILITLRKLGYDPKDFGFDLADLA